MTTPVLVSENDLNDLRQLIEQRSGIRFDSDRERFFSGRIREHAQERNLGGSGDLMRRIQSSNVEYEALLARLLTHETSFFRYPAAYDALTKHALPEVHAGMRETSVMLILDPGDVHLDRLPDSFAINETQREEVTRLILHRGTTWPWTSDDPRISTSGITGGDPRLASAELGESIVASGLDACDAVLKQL